MAIRNFGTGAALAIAAITGWGPVQALTPAQIRQIDEGFRLFTTETFGGNGRTCGTCHLPNKNYTISPADLRHLTRQQKNLVFASTTPGLENKELVRKFTLFNIGPGNANDESPVGPLPLFRTSMTMAGLNLTVSNCRVPTGAPCPDLSPNPNDPRRQPQLGWAGEGSPRDFFHHNNNDLNADASFRSFTNGAIGQHFPKTLKRATVGPQPDFRFATDEELDAMEAFLKWLGRRPVNPADPELPVNREFNLRTGETIPNPNTPPPTTVPAPVMTFKDARVQGGLAIFTSPQASCNSCHRNAGAHFRLGGNLALNPGTNFNSHTDVDEERDRLSLLTGVNIPEDEGGLNTPFGAAPTIGAFNIQSLIEAPRKQSFFHLGAVTDFEQALAFYFRDPFLSSPEGDPDNLPFHCRTIACLEDPITGFGPKPLERLGAFLRSLSAFYSLRDCERLIAETIERIDLGAPPRLPALHCEFALDDVTSVLGTAKISPRPFPAVRVAAQLLKQLVPRVATNKRALQQMLTVLAFLRTQIATLEPPPLP